MKTITCNFHDYIVKFNVPWFSCKILYSILFEKVFDRKYLSAGLSAFLMPIWYAIILYAKRFVFDNFVRLIFIKVQNNKYYNNNLFIEINDPKAACHD